VLLHRHFRTCEASDNISPGRDLELRDVFNDAKALPVGDFGDAGRIDLRDNLGREPKNWVTMTSPGIVYKELLIVGSSMAETLPDSPGNIRAYDVRSGKLRWSFHTIPHPGQFGSDTWPKDAYKYMGGVDVWGEITVDEKRGIAYFPVASAKYELYGGDRPGNNLYADCLLALDARTGKHLWHYQTVHHDVWDYDAEEPPALVDAMWQGQPRKLLVQANRNGFLYVLDEHPAPELMDKVRMAANNCPTGAITLVEDERLALDAP